jgi:hypothetical protein
LKTGVGGFIFKILKNSDIPDYEGKRTYKSVTMTAELSVEWKRKLVKHE